MGEPEPVLNAGLQGDPRRYQLYGVIASGGTATVHYARLQGEAGFARTVAIKRLHPEYARDPEFLAMFLDEARLAARVQHPNVVRTLDVVAGDADLLLVMEYVPAVSLAHLLRTTGERGERVPPAVAVAVVADILRGLHAAHEATDEQGEPLDIVHRDVSPQNILVGPDGAARVLDFGIAKATGRAAGATREGHVKGKFAYMAPEQITNVCVSRQSDVFAASIILWEALTGRRLFQADSEAGVLARVLSAPIEPPSALAADVTPELDAIVLRGLARDLSERYSSARDMTRELEAHVRLASASEVGDWVEGLAGDELALRSAAVAEIENASRRGRVSVRAFLAGGAATSPPQGATPLDQRKPRRLALLAAMALVGLAAIAGTVVAKHLAAPHPLPPAASAELKLQTDPGSPVAPAATDVAASPPTARGNTAPIMKPGPLPVAVPRMARGRVEAPPVAQPSRGDAARTSHCDPPYHVDANGHLIYRPECFP